MRKEADRMKLEKGQKLLFIGDSITDYGRSPAGENNSPYADWGEGYPSIVRGHLISFYPELGIRVVNKGTGGNQTRDLIARWDEDVMALKPDWVSILIGTNDVWRRFDAPVMTERHVPIQEYEGNMRWMIDRTLPMTKNIVLMSPYFMEPNREDPMRVAMDAEVAVCKKLAEEYGLIFVDLQAEFDRIMEHVHPMAISWDYIHPGPIGRVLIANKFLEAVGAIQTNQ